MLGGLLLAAGPAQAGPIGYSDIVSLASVYGARQAGRASVDLRLRLTTQQQGKTPAQTPAPPATTQDGKTASGGAAEGASGGAAGSNGSLTGTEVAPQQQSGTTVETIQVGEVDGTICDCGEIAAIPGGFPLWPLLGLGALPLAFISGGDDELFPPDDIPPTPGPPTPTPQIPEPATLLLFGTGLAAIGARARRRHAARRSQPDAVREV